MSTKPHPRGVYPGHADRARGFGLGPRRVLSIYRTRDFFTGRSFPRAGSHSLIVKKKFLSLLVVGRSNKEIGSVLGIEERTVKAHVAKAHAESRRPERIALSVHAITHFLVTSSK